MWQPYLNVIAERLGQAVHVVDRFRVMQQFGKALDEIRAEESKRLVRDGYEPVLKKSRWCFLKRPENLTDKQTVKLSELLKYNLRTVRATHSKVLFLSNPFIQQSSGRHVIVDPAGTLRSRLLRTMLGPRILRQPRLAGHLPQELRHLHHAHSLDDLPFPARDRAHHP